MSRVLAGAGIEVPAWVLRVALGLLLLGLSVMHAGDAWGWIAAFVGLGAVASPWVQLAWVSMLSLALSELAQPAGAGAWHPYVMLAGLALAQVIAARTAITPLSARVELRVFGRPLLLAAAVAAPCEGLLALALALRLRGAALPGWLPATVIAALALLGLGWLLFARLLPRGD
jgi:hypothetical protein